MKQSEETRKHDSHRDRETTPRDREATENAERRRGTGRTDGPAPKKTRPRDRLPDADS